MPTTDYQLLVRLTPDERKLVAMYSQIEKKSMGRTIVDFFILKALENKDVDEDLRKALEQDIAEKKLKAFRNFSKYQARLFHHTGNTLRRMTSFAVESIESTGNVDVEVLRKTFETAKIELGYHPKYTRDIVEKTFPELEKFCNPEVMYRRVQNVAQNQLRIGVTKHGRK